MGLFCQRNFIVFEGAEVRSMRMGEVFEFADVTGRTTAVHDSLLRPAIKIAIINACG